MSRLMLILVLLSLLGWWLNRAWHRERLPAARTAAAEPPKTLRFERRGEQLHLLRDDPKKFWMALLYALLGPLSWPLLAWRYGGVAATGWAVVAWVLHVGTARLLLSAPNDPTLWLWLPVTPVLYLALGQLMMRGDTPRRAKALAQRGWRCLDPVAA